MTFHYFLNLTILFKRHPVIFEEKKYFFISEIIDILQTIKGDFRLCIQIVCLDFTTKYMIIFNSDLILKDESVYFSLQFKHNFS